CLQTCPVAERIIGWNPLRYRHHVLGIHDCTQQHPPDRLRGRRVMEWFLLRALAWVLAPLLLITLAVGPKRTWQAVRKSWTWLPDRRHEPTEVLNRVVREHEKSIRALREVLQQAESAQADIVRNCRRSEESIAALEREARDMVRSNDDLGARAA